MLAYLCSLPIEAHSKRQATDTMTVTQAPRLEFAPPPPRGLLRALVLAIAVHALLLVVLAMGVRWKRDPPVVSVEAELWSAIPIQAAPPPPVEKPPLPVEVTPPPIAPPPPVTVDPQIALAKEKLRLVREKQLQDERVAQDARKKAVAIEQKRVADLETQKKLAQEKHDREKKLAQDERKAQEAKAEAESRKLAEIRKQQLERINRLAGQASGNGEAESAGSAKQSSGPSASYGGRIRARVKPNITYTENLTSNPAAEVEVRTIADGTIISRRLLKSSGVRSWDEAVLNAIDKTEILPKDTDGRVPSVLTLIFRPKD